MLSRLQQQQRPIRRNAEPPQQTVNETITNSLISDGDNPDFQRKYRQIYAVINTTYELTKNDVNIELILKGQEWAETVNDLEPYLEKLVDNGRTFSTQDSNHYRPTRQ